MLFLKIFGVFVIVIHASTSLYEYKKVRFFNESEQKKFKRKHGIFSLILISIYFLCFILINLWIKNKI